MAIQFGNRLLLSKAKAFSSRNNAFFFSFFFSPIRYSIIEGREPRVDVGNTRVSWIGDAFRKHTTGFPFFSSFFFLPGEVGRTL